MSNRKIALMDMDNTLVDYIGVLVKDLNALRSPNEKEVMPEDIDNPERWLSNRMELIKSQPGWWKKLPKLSDGFTVLGYATQIGFKIQICTKGPYNALIGWEEKVHWCRKNIEKLDDLTITTDKSGIYGTVLVEDWPPYITSWLEWRKKGLVILMDRPYNKDFTHPQVVRFVDGNAESSTNVINALKEAYNR